MNTSGVSEQMISRSNDSGRRNFFRWLTVIIIFPILGLLAWYPALFSPFIYDDNYLVKSARFNTPGSLIQGLFHYNRPLVWLLDTTSFHLWGLNPLGYHLVNIAIHAANALLLMGLFTLLFRRFRQREPSPLLTGIVGLFFLLNGSLSMSVVLISARSVLLVTFFYLLALILFVRALDSDRRFIWLGVAAAYFAALLSKEIAITLPAALLLLALADGQSLGTMWHRHRKLAVLISIITIGFLVKLSHFSYGGTIGSTQLPFNRWEYLLTEVTAWLHYLKIFVIPYPAWMSGDWAWPVIRGPFEPQFLLALVIILAVLTGLILAWTRRQRVLAVGGLFFFLFLAPTSSLVPIADPVMEYRLYLPAVGLTLGIGMLVFLAIRKLFENRLQWRTFAQVTLLLLLTIVLVLSLRARLEAYRSTEAFWQDAALKSPDKIRPHFNLAQTYTIQGKWAQALRQGQIALTIEPDASRVLSLLGDIYREKGDYPKALELYKQSLSRDSQNYDVVNKICHLLLETGHYPEAWHYLSRFTGSMKDDGYYMNLATYLNKTGQPERAIAIYRFLLDRSPELFAAWSNLGGIYANQGDYAKAETCYHRALHFNPRYYLAYYGLGSLFLQTKQMDEALDNLTRARDLNPSFPWTYYQLGNFFAMLRNYAAAEDNFAVFLKSQPDHAEAWYRQGLVKEELHEPAAARTCFRQALTLRPDWEPPRKALADLEENH